MKSIFQRRTGQSIVEYVVLLALVAIVVITVVAGIGQRSRSRVALANEALDEAAVATATASAGKPPVAGISSGGDHGGHSKKDLHSGD